jgi:sulfonate transport system substrate-binding protein
VADAFHQLDLIPRPVKVAEIVWQPKAAQLASKQSLAQK